MSKFFSLLSGVILMAQMLNACSPSNSENKFNIPPQSEKTKVELADPFILYDNGTYYAYGTSSAQGFKAYVSEDMETWQLAATSLPDNLVLQKGNGVWGEGNFWAPEVYRIEDTYYMFYSANTRICVAMSDSPLGPFKQNTIAPIVPDEGCIDHHLFRDDDGKFYIFFVRFNDGNNIWMSEISKDLQTIAAKSTWKHCVSVSEPWENIMGRIIEGPFVVKHNGVYYLSYSGNDYQSQDYAVGYATSESLTNPVWTKYDGNPILHRPGTLVGTGHHSFFKDASGDLKIVFHAHYNRTTIHPRQMYISDAEFKSNDGTDILSVSTGYKIPVLKTD